ncbi:MULTISPECIES: hypothetical protein [Acidianus]|uniref:Uncharacterized protein n=1 Tax=Candidatus Acidianus copahuensis TaxID=1160895 RepID=A0A031LL83_9CREN|nr:MULTISPECIES: hypothetical protein [Acidianus]EZQ04797.1 hypothetical protein CM19_07365 [Candidatus Acidianus copahuensis]NON63456.1 hypothetical protein [Acidianus sp. RZ1]
MSELDFLLKKKKSSEEKIEKIEKREEENQEKREDYNVKTEEKSSDPLNYTEENGEKKQESGEKSIDSIEEIMNKFLEKDPKIGVWSYPAFLVLQYLYNTKPGFRIGKVAKEALEIGLRQLYPELFDRAIDIYKNKVR